MVSGLVANRYEVAEKIGAGGMGTVFRARDTTTGGDVAVKLLKQDAIDSNPGVVERFMREAEALRQLNHPNIVKVQDTFDHEGQRLIVMEYVTGGSLYEALRERGRLPIVQSLEIALDLADALTRAHRLKIIHRDLKPANVLLSADGSPRLTDFGVAHMGSKERVTATGISIGTPDYMAPEVLNGDAVDERADIWSFGVMLFEMLAGHRPFAGESLTRLLTSILTEPVPDLEAIRPDAPVALVDLIYRMLAKDHDTRIPSIRLVGAELEAILRGGALLSTGTSIRVSRVQEAKSGGAGTRPVSRSFTPSTASGRHNLPAETTPFVGRETELQQLYSLLGDPNIRLVTVLGPGGMGKSRLSMELGRHQINHFGSGVYVVWLSGLSSPDRIVPTIAEAVGFAFQDGKSQLDQLLDYFREKQMLLVMDNFEHVIEGAYVVDEILRAAPGVKIIATSRERLNLSSETLFNLDGMDFPEWETPEDALRYSAVKLFMQSARRARPGFDLQSGDLTYVARICRMVYGIPLGIILAAAWVEALTLEEIAEELNDSLDFLESEMRDLPERHRSIRAVFEYSWNLLKDDERDIFVKLAVFRNGFDRDAARKITGTSLRTLTTLVNKSLVRRNPTTGRYYLHFLLHEYAAEHFLDLPDADTILRNHAEYYADVFNKLSWDFFSHRELIALETSETELENAQQAVDWALARHEWFTVYKFLRPMWLYYIGRSLMIEGAGKFADIANRIAEAGADNHPTYWATRVYEMSQISRLGEYERAWEVSNDAFEHLRVDKMTVDMVEALNNMAYARMRQGRYDESKHHAAAGRVFAEDGKLPMAVKFTPIAHLGYAEFLSGNLDEAHRIYKELLSDIDLNSSGSITGRAFSLNNLGEILNNMGKFDEAIAMFAEAYSLFKDLKQKRGMAFSMNNLAGTNMMIGHFSDAMKNFSETYELSREIGDRAGMADSLSLMGNVCEAMSEPHRAYEHYQQALTMRRGLGDLRAIGDSLHDLTMNRFMNRDVKAAYEFSNEEVKFRKMINEPGLLSIAQAWRGASTMLLGNLEAGEKDMAEARQLSTRSQSPYASGMVNVIRGESYLHTGRAQEAYDHFLGIVDSALEQDIPIFLIYVTGGLIRSRIGVKPSHENYLLAAEGIGSVSQAALFYSESYLSEALHKIKDEGKKVISQEEFDEAYARGRALEGGVRAFAEKLRETPL